MNIIFIAIIAITAYLIYRIIRWTKIKRSRRIPKFIKIAVLKRYFGMCAVCPETWPIDFHHRIEFSKGGDHSEKNVVPLCPRHHAMITRLK